MGKLTEITEVPTGTSQEGRRYDRFYVLHQEAWSVKLDSNFCKGAEIENLNSVGIQIRLPHFRKVDLGERIPIELSLYDAEVIICEAEVRWVQADLKNPYAKVVGLKFIDPYCRVAQAWQERQVKLHVGRSKINELPELELADVHPQVRRVKA